MMETEVKPTDRPISMVYFDLGNVLLKFDHEQSCRNLGKLFHVPAPDVRNFVFESGLEDQYETGELSTRNSISGFVIAGSNNLHSPVSALPRQIYSRLIAPPFLC